MRTRTRLLRPILLATTLLLAIASATSSAHAWTWEPRLHIGAVLTKPDQLNEGLPEDIKAREFVTFGADLLFFLPVTAESPAFGAGIGLRYDAPAFFKNDGQMDKLGNAFEVAPHLFSVLAQKRWNWNQFYVAPSLALGLYQPSYVNVRIAPGSWIQYKANHVRSFTAAVEGGWVSDIYLVGFEAGYQYLKLSELQADDGSKFLTPSGAEKTADLNGPYVRFLLGLHFE